MPTTTLTSKGQMTLPKDVREDMGLKVGDKIDVVKEGDKYVLRARNVKAADLAGILGKPPVGRGLTIEGMDEAVGKALAEDDERIRAGR